MFEHAAKLGWEGIVSKNAHAPYRSDWNEAWLKIKTVQKGKFPVIGFVKDPTGVLRSTLERGKGKNWYTWARSGRAGPGRFQARSRNSSIPWSARSQN
jgi:bifunctional non-homologous end joining protein LigD